MKPGDIAKVINQTQAMWPLDLCSYLKNMHYLSDYKKELWYFSLENISQI